jgi:SAM-dependent methyltransferase
MRPDLVTHLNDINRAFYQATSDDFDQTRQTAWAGWARVRPYLSAGAAVLDVGCGNARFAAFAGVGSADGPRHYHGVDNSPQLLARAEQRLRALGGGFGLTLHDVIVDGPLPAELTGCDLIVLFGVMHHVPSHALRATLLRQLGGRLARGGVLIWAAWQFLDDARLRERVVPWPPELAGEVEAGDVLLDWRRGGQAVRYCHHCDEAEWAALTAASGLTLVEEWWADGASGRMNRYGVLAAR